MSKFKFYSQLDGSDCGPTCLKMIAEYYGKVYSLQSLRNISFITKQGVSLYTISEAAEKIGFHTLKLELTYKSLIDNAILPCVLFWDNQHFVILYKVEQNKKGNKFYIADPGIGKRILDDSTFLQSWIYNKGKEKGVALFLEPTEKFYSEEEIIEKKNSSIWEYIRKYLFHHKKLFFQLLVGMVISSCLSLLFPFITQNIVDHGVRNKDINFISLLLIFQLVLFASSTFIEYVRGQLLLYISTRINVSIISEFLTKLMSLSISFFDSRKAGDIMTRIDDQKRIEYFLTTNILSTFFSFFNLIILSLVLLKYKLTIFIIFSIGSICSLLWTILFLEKRKNQDYKLFSYMSRNREDMFELISGMQEVKLNNLETYKRWKWEALQAKLFKLNIRNLNLEQYQLIGSNFFTQLKNILITYFAAKAVIDNDISLGMMLSISYIIGQLNSPLEQLVTFVKAAQMAKISVARMNEIKDQKSEEEESQIISSSTHESLFHTIEKNSINSISPIFKGSQSESICKSIVFKNVSFRYGAPGTQSIFDNLNLTIKLGKVTAIVGNSGSGKTTLIKLILKFYKPNSGTITINDYNLENISPSWWRSNCGAVMQEGFIFSDTIRKNIIGAQENIDEDKFFKATNAANVDVFVKDLPLGYDTIIGKSGTGLSMGQRQRILIARSIYKDPKILIFDEATSSLDSNNEREIVDNLNQVLPGKTAIIIAHRLSTVKNADEIIVLDNGSVVEIGNHNQLCLMKGFYFNLVKNQLELSL